MRIVPARVEDAEALTDLHLDVWDEAYADLMPAVRPRRAPRAPCRAGGEGWSGIIANGSSDNLLAWAATTGCSASPAPAAGATRTTACRRSR